MHEYSSGPLTEDELKAFREMLEADRRAKWFWALSRSIAIWIVAVTTGFVAFYDSVAAMLNRAFGIK
jgi:hypothetical protein